MARNGSAAAEKAKAKKKIRKRKKENSIYMKYDDGVKAGGIRYISSAIVNCALRRA